MSEPKVGPSKALDPSQFSDENFGEYLKSIVWVDAPPKIDDSLTDEFGNDLTGDDGEPLDYHDDEKSITAEPE